MFRLALCVLFLSGCDTQAVEIKEPEKVVEIPERSKPYAKYFEGSINPSREMAQTEQESAWNPIAESPYAKGLRQFTDSTGEWVATTMCRHLGKYDPFNPEWSIRCGIIYQESLQTEGYGEYCNNRRIAEQRYNGGSWVLWELRTAKSSNLEDAEHACYEELYNGRQRKGWACKENYEYPRYIDKRQSKYMDMGGKTCSG